MAFKWYSKATDQGFAAAEVSLAGMYGRSEGVKQDYAAALSLCRKAASKGMRTGRPCSPSFILRGIGVPKDYNEAAK